MASSLSTKRQRTDSGPETLKVKIMRVGDNTRIIQTVSAVSRVVLHCDASREPTLFDIVSQLGVNAYCLTADGLPLTNLNFRLSSTYDTFYMRGWKDSEAKAQKVFAREYKKAFVAKLDHQITKTQLELSFLKKVRDNATRLLDE